MLPSTTQPRHPSYYAPTYSTEAAKFSTAPSYYTTKAPEFYITTFASPVYYREALKYQSRNF
jgi:hypothetical protein